MNKIYQISSYILFILFIFFAFLWHTAGDRENPKHATEMRNMDSIIKFQKCQLDTLMWYNEIGYKVKD